MNPALLSMRGVSKHFERGGALQRLIGHQQRIIALDDVTLDVQRGDVVGIVGESGSGKSTLASLAVGLAQPTSGEIFLEEAPLSQLMRNHAGPWRRRIQMVFQDSGTALNPRKSVGRCLMETLALCGLAADERPAQAQALLDLVSLPPEMMARLPHELSGGQRQRVGLARALAMQPDILVADEPVSSLDVSLQAQVINLLSRLTRELGLTLLFISHDLALVRSLCSRIVVMRAGRIVEEGSCTAVLDHPQHAYTRALIAAVPKGLAGRRTAPQAPATEPHQSIPSLMSGSSA